MTQVPRDLRVSLTRPGQVTSPPGEPGALSPVQVARVLDAYLGDHQTPQAILSDGALPSALEALDMPLTPTSRDFIGRLVVSAGAAGQWDAPSYSAEQMRQLADDYRAFRARDPAVAVLAHALQTKLAAAINPKSWEPSARAEALLNAIADAAKEPRRATLPTAQVDTRGNTVATTVLHTGDEIWAATAALIRQARRSIQLQTFLFYRHSEAAKHLFCALDDLQHRLARERATGRTLQPIQLDILLNDSRGGIFPRALNRSLVSGGSTAYPAVPGAPRPPEDPDYAGDPLPRHHALLPFPLDPALIALRVFAHDQRGRGALHGKLFIVDGTAALLGTANVKGNHHRVSTDNCPLMDEAIGLRGPAVASMQAEFAAHLAASTTQLVGRNKGAAAQPLEAIEARRARSPTVAPAPLPHHDDVTREKVSALVAQLQSAPGAGTRIVAITQRPLYSWFTRRPRSPQAAAFLAALGGARERIEINHVNVNATEVLEALKAALARGVAVDIVLPRRADDNFYRRSHRRNEDIYRRLNAFVRTRPTAGKLRTRWHRVDGATPAGANHTKILFVDRALVIFGSANLDSQSWKYAGEFGIATHDPAAVAVLRNAAFADAFESGADYVPGAES